MASYSTNEFRGGLKILVDGDPYAIVNNDVVKPGKGQAFNRVKIKNLKNGRVVEKTWKSGESVEAADVMDSDLEYSYTDGEFWYFMDTVTFDQYPASETAVGEAIKWLKEGDSYVVTFWNGAPLSVAPPNFVELTVTQCDPGLKGDTAQGGSKPATVETGAVIKVPLFVEEGDILKIDTRTGEYLSRASK